MTDARRRYFELMQREPERFENPPQAGITILREPAEMDDVEAKKAAELRAQSLPAEWATIGVVLEDQYVRVVRDAVEFSDRSRGTYIRVLSRQRGVAGVAILAVDRVQALLIRQFRHAPRRWMLEIPRGFVDDGETPLEAAARELKEETGASPEGLQSLGIVHPNTGMYEEAVELFFCRVSQATPMATCEGKVELLAIEKLGELLAAGALSDSFTSVAYFRAAARKLIANPF